MKTDVFSISRVRNREGRSVAEGVGEEGMIEAGCVAWGRVPRKEGEEEEGREGRGRWRESRRWPKW